MANVISAEMAFRALLREAVIASKNGSNPWHLKTWLEVVETELAKWDAGEYEQTEAKAIRVADESSTKTLELAGKYLALAEKYVAKCEELAQVKDDLIRERGEIRQAVRS